MFYVYMDESGDLGFNLGTGNSKYFLVTFLVVSDPRVTEHTMKKIVNKLKKKNMSLSFGVFHAFKENKDVIIDFLKYISGKDIKIMTYILNKDKYLQSDRISKDTHLLYNNMCSKLLKKGLSTGILNGSQIKFCAARKETNKFLNMQFINHIKESLRGIYDIDVFLRYPKQEKGLQLVDGISYSIYQKYQNNVSDFYEIIKDKITVEEFV